MLKERRVVVIKTVQERNKNTSYEDSQVPRTCRQHCRWAQVCDSVFLSLHKCKDGGYSIDLSLHHS